MNKTDNHIEIFGQRVVSVKGTQDRRKIKHRIETYMDKYHSQTSMVIKEEREEEQENNRMILT